MTVEETLAQRYATAYVNLFEDQLSLESCERLDAAQNFFEKYPVAELVLKLSTVTVHEKKACMEAFVQAFSLPDTLNRLIQLLLQHNRSQLFPMILSAIAALYKKRNNITHFDIMSSHTLSDKALNVILDYLRVMTGKHILYTVKVDKELIAGLRLQSDTRLWEYSINKQLAQLQRNFNA